MWSSPAKEREREREREDEKRKTRKMPLPVRDFQSELTASPFPQDTKAYRPLHDCPYGLRTFQDAVPACFRGCALLSEKGLVPHSPHSRVLVQTLADIS